VENLKIRVNNEAESKKAQELFFELGASLSNGDKHAVLVPSIVGLAIIDDLINFIFNDVVFADIKQCEEITLPKLRDLVVLKRNDVGDANYIRPRDGKEYFKSSQNNFYHMLDSEWIMSTWENRQLEPQLKPIEKPMKEYLIKSGDGKYLLTHHDSIGAIEIPEGCNIITCEERKCGLVYFHWKSLDSDEFFLKDEKIWSNNFDETLFDFIEKNEGDVVIIWSRHTHPEELPFIDDEPKIETATGYQLDVVGSNTYGSRGRYDGESDISYRQYLMNFIVGNRTESLNDQYAEIEKVRQSAWQKQEGGSHYKNLKIQPMQYALENKLDYAQANVVKYVTRHADKNGKEDLLKAIHNLELMIEFYYGDEK